MRLEEFSSHREEKDEKTVGHQTYRLFTENGKLTGICEIGELRGQIYHREGEEIKEDLFRRVVRTFAGENAPELKRFMTEIKGDVMYSKIAKEEIARTVENLRSIIAC